MACGVMIFVFKKIRILEKKILHFILLHLIFHVITAP